MHLPGSIFIEVSLHPAPFPTDLMVYLVDYEFRSAGRALHSGIAVQPQKRHKRSTRTSGLVQGE